MALRDRPGQHVHRALKTLRDIDTDDLSTADKRRVEVATLLLSDVSVRSEINQTGVVDT